MPKTKRTLTQQVGKKFAILLLLRYFFIPMLLAKYIVKRLFAPFGGGLHCATVDIHRDGVMEDYFPIRHGRF
ncbi:hypothetical protein AB1F87_004150 [Vibrio mimicus]